MENLYQILNVSSQATEEEIKNEEKLKAKAGNKNPLDASDLFEKFMGIKR